MLAGLGASPVLADEASAMEPVPQSAQLPALIEMDSLRLYRRMSQLGMVSQQLGFSLDVGADGTASACRLARPFRSPYTNKEACKALVRYIKLAPARDAQGTAIEGTYESAVNLWTFFRPDR